MERLDSPKPFHRVRRFARFIALTLVGLACSEAGPPRPGAVTSVRELPVCDLSGTTARCGSHSVWENRSTQSGRRLTLNFAVLPSRSTTPAPDPVFFLAGGPGQGAAALAHAMAPMFEGLRRDRDIVFVDQRGTGKSNPLDCELADPEDLSEQFRTEFDIAKLRECVSKLDADPSQYTTAAAAADLDEVRAALGYEKINLIGASYGTRLALNYAATHPAHLRTMLLDGVAPPELRLFLDFLPDGQRALELAFDACDKNPDCKQSYPNLRGDFNAVLTRLKAEPLRATVNHPETGKPIELRLDVAGFATAVRGMLYSAEVSRLLPLVIHQVARGNLEALLAQSLLVSRSVRETLSLGLLLSVTCAEDLPRISDAELAELDAKTFVPSSVVREMRRACAAWPHAKLAEPPSKLAASDVPTLLLSGELDPATPPRWGELARQSLSQGLHVVVPGHAHGTLGAGCVPKLAARFIRAGRTEGLDTSCVSGLLRPQFFLDLLGPSP